MKNTRAKDSRAMLAVRNNSEVYEGIETFVSSPDDLILYMQVLRSLHHLHSVDTKMSTRQLGALFVRYVERATNS